jgi:hypothetical protein
MLASSFIRGNDVDGAIKGIYDNLDKSYNEIISQKG